MDGIDALETGRVEGGTAIGMGLATAVNRLRKSDAKSKVVILITDGENNQGQIEPLDAAQLARLESVQVYTVGVGTIGKAKSPVRQRPDGSYIYDWVEVNIDEPTLKGIAEETGGRYFRATSGEKLQEIYTEIDTLEKTRFNVFRYNKKTEEFAILVWLVRPPLLAAEAVLPSRVIPFVAMTTRSYKVFAHVTGLVLFEIAFWMAVVGFSLLLRKVAPQLDLQVGTAWPALLIPPVGLLLFAGHYLWKQKRMADVADLDCPNPFGRMPDRAVTCGNSSCGERHWPCSPSAWWIPNGAPAWKKSKAMGWTSWWPWT